MPYKSQSPDRSAAHATAGASALAFDRMAGRASSAQSAEVIALDFPERRGGFSAARKSLADAMALLRDTSERARYISEVPSGTAEPNGLSKPPQRSSPFDEQRVLLAQPMRPHTSEREAVRLYSGAKSIF